MRRRLPAVERAARVGIDARWLDADEELPAALARTAKFLRRPRWGRASCRVPASATNSSSGSGGPPGLPATWRASQPRTCCDESPGIRKRRLGRVDQSPMSSATAPRVDSSELCRRSGTRPSSLSRFGADDEADRLDMVQPFEIGIALEFRWPWRSPRRRPEIDKADRLQPMGAHLVGCADARGLFAQFRFAAARAASASGGGRPRARAALRRRTTGQRELVADRTRRQPPWRCACAAVRAGSASDLASSSPRFGELYPDVAESLVGDPSRASARDRQCPSRSSACNAR